MGNGLREKVINLIRKNDYLFFIVKYFRLRFLSIFTRSVSDEDYIRRQYKKRTGRDLNLDNPDLYNEKVQYEKLYYRNPVLTKLADKFEVRKFVEERIGREYLTKLYGVYDSVKEIPFDELPEKFVMKLTNGSGFNYICTKKSKKEIRRIKRRFKKWMKLDFYMLGREWAYKDIKNRIICEEYLESDTSYGLNDYKVFCFGGEPKIIQVDFSRFVDHRRNLYAPDWTFIDEKVAYENDPSADIPKPVIVGVCDLSEDARRYFTDNFDTVKYSTTDYHELLAAEDIDAVYCAVPHNLHKQFYVDIINAGKHLLGEKPFGIDKEDNAAIL